MLYTSYKEVISYTSNIYVFLYNMRKLVTMAAIVRMKQRHNAFSNSDGNPAHRTWLTNLIPFLKTPNMEEMTTGGCEAEVVIIGVRELFNAYRALFFCWLCEYIFVDGNDVGVGIKISLVQTADCIHNDIAYGAVDSFVNNINELERLRDIHIMFWVWIWVTCPWTSLDPLVLVVWVVHLCSFL